MLNCTADSDWPHGHVSIPASGLKDWFEHALISNLCDGRLVVDWVDPKWPGMADVFIP